MTKNATFNAYVESTLMRQLTDLARFDLTTIMKGKDKIRTKPAESIEELTRRGEKIFGYHE